MGLAAVGISTEAEEIYRYFLRHREEGVGSVREALDIDPDTVEAEVEKLSRLSLLDITDRHRVRPTEPGVAIERLIERRLEELNTEIRHVLEARDSIGSFAEDHQRGESLKSVLDIERIEGVERVRQRLDDLAFFAYESTLAIQPGGPMSPPAIEAARPLDARSLRRGLTLKFVYHPDALDEPRMAAYVRDLVQLGAQVRVTAEPLDRTVIFDRSVSVVPIDPKLSARGALIVREPGLVSQLVTYFDGVWEGAEEPRDFLGIASDGPSLSDLDKRVLAALAESDKDEVAARDLDVSVRTYRRYVADIMARLGAVNRFQAALRAKDENWI